MVRRPSTVRVVRLPATHFPPLLSAFTFLLGNDGSGHPCSSVRSSVISIHSAGVELLVVERADNVLELGCK